MKPTIRKIAEMAGVSRGTVDRVLNDRSGVRPDIRERVLRIAAEMKYEPNIAAKALAFSKKPMIIGVIMPPSDIRFFDEIRLGVAAALEEVKGLGMRTECRNVSNDEPKGAVSAIEELMGLGVSGIMISAMDAPEIRMKIDAAVEAKIPVVTFNSDISGCKRLCFVGQDLYKSGRIAAGLMSKIVGEGSGIVAVAGSVAFQAHSDRIRGFSDALQDAGKGLKVAEVIESFDRYADTYRKLSSALSRYGNVKGIYMATGHVGACADVLKEMGVHRSVRVVCNDTMPEVVENMKNGIIDFTIVQNPFMQGYRALKILHEHIFLGKEPESEYIFTETGIKILENL